MPGFDSINDLNKETLVNGKQGEIHFLVTSCPAAAGVQNVFNELITVPPGAFGFSGTAGVATAMSNSTSGIIYPINGPVSPDKRFLSSIQVSANNSTIATMVGWIFDSLLYYPSLNINASPTTLDNTVTLPRYTDGVGVQALVVVTTTLTTAAPSLTFTYTADDNSSQSGILMANASSTSRTQLFTNKSTVPKGGPFLPWTGAIQGIKKLDSYTIANGTATGSVAAMLVRPLAMFATSAQGVGQEKDLIFQFPSLPEIKDNACLGLIFTSLGVTQSAPIRGKLTYIWG